MFFYVQGPSKHDLMPLEKIFDRREVKQASAIDKTDAVNASQIKQSTQKYQQSLSAKSIYKEIDTLPEDGPAIFAYQIMKVPVVTLTPVMTVDQALKLFRQKRFRHLPVVSSSKKVIGMVSDRDVMQYLADLQKSSTPHNTGDRIENLMHSPVLTASKQTDVRYIARLFVEHRVGAMPVVDNGVLKGMITRSDILHAVMNHYELELWI